MEFGQDFEKVFFRLSLVKPKYLQSIQSAYYTSEEIGLLSHIAGKFYERFNETPTKDQIKLLVTKHERAKEKVTDGILDLVFGVDLDQYDEEWLTTTTESWIKWKTFSISLTDTIEFIKDRKSVV